MNSTAQKIIETLQLEPLEMEGGFFRRTYTSSEYFQETKRSAGSAIYYLLTPDTHSKIHRLPIDEIYHFYLGDPVELLLLRENGKTEVVNLHSEVLMGAQPQFVVPKNVWQGSRLKPGGQFALLGTTMSPAFEYEDFQTPENVGELLKEYPGSVHQLIGHLF